MESIGINVNLHELRESKRLMAVIVRKVGPEVAIYIGMYAALINSGAQLSDLAGESACKGFDALAAANFLAAMAAMRAPEGYKEVLQANLNCMAKVNALLAKWIEGMAEQGVEPHEMPGAQSQLHAYMEKHLVLIEEIQLIESL